jgi:hypothetical protein
MAASAKGKGGAKENARASGLRGNPPSRRALLLKFNTSSWEKAT